MLESKFQHDLKGELKQRFPGCVIMKTDATEKQGFPDLLVLYKNKWAALECKRSSDANLRPNQKYYVDMLNDMSYSSFIFPENKEEVLNDLEQTFRS